MLNVPPSNPDGIQPPVGGAKRILLIEDDADYIELLKESLEINDFSVDNAKNGKDALNLVLKTDFDAIVCDMVMPELSGDMFYLAVQRSKPHLCKRFIFISGHKGEERIDRFIRKVNGVLLWKPFTMNELLDTVHLILETTGENL